MPRHPSLLVTPQVTDKNYLRTEAELIENPIDEIAAMHVLSQPGHEHVLPLLDHMQVGHQQQQASSSPLTHTHLLFAAPAGL